MSDVTLGITLTGDASGFRGEVKLTREDLDRLRKEAEGVGAAGGRAGRGFDLASQSAGRWRNVARAANDNTRQLAGGYDQARRRADLLRVAILALATGAAARVISSFIAAASETENLRVRLRFLTDDAEAAADALIGYAARVPFTFQQIQQAAPILLTVARDQAEFNRLLEITGDIAAASGLSFVETAQQIQRSLSAGINSADLFRERGVRAMLGFQAGVETSAEQTREHILGLWEDSSFALAGAAAEMADTWTGLTSMLGDKWFQFRVRLMDGAPFDFLKAVVAELDAELGANFDTIGEAADRLGEELVGTVEEIALGAAAAADTLTPIATAAARVTNRLIESFNNLPPFMQQAGLFGALLFGKRFGIALFGGFALADEMAAISEQVLDEMGVARDSILRDIFVGHDVLERENVGPVPGGSEEALSDFMGRVRARIAAAREDQAGRTGGRGRPGGSGDSGEAVASEADKVRQALEEEAGALARLAAAWQGYGVSVEEATIRNEIDAQLRAAKVSALSEEGLEIARLVRENAAHKNTIEDAEAAGRKHADTVAEIRDRLQETRPAYEGARLAAMRWRAEAMAGLDETKAGFAEFAAQVDEIYNHMLKEAHEDSLEDSRRWQDGVTRGFRSYAQEATDAGAAAERGITGSLSTMEDALVKFTTTGKIAWGDMVNSMISDIARLMIRQQITGPIAGFLGDIDFSGMFSSTPDFAAQAQASAAATAGVFHRGGIVGAGGVPQRAVDPGLFAGAPRFRNGGVVGLGPDERPIVAHVGEEVLTPADPRHRDNRAGGAGGAMEIVLRIVDGDGNEIPTRQRRGGDGQLDVELMIDQTVGRLGRRRGSETRRMLEEGGYGPGLRNL